VVSRRKVRARRYRGARDRITVNIGTLDFEDACARPRLHRRVACGRLQQCARHASRIARVPLGKILRTSMSNPSSSAAAPASTQAAEACAQGHSALYVLPRPGSFRPWRHLGSAELGPVTHRKERRVCTGGKRLRVPRLAPVAPHMRCTIAMGAFYTISLKKRTLSKSETRRNGPISRSALRSARFIPHD